MTIEIEALDTLFFRDGKPFSMGDDAWANSMFPPLPSVLYGAIRTAYMAQKNIAIDDIIKETENLRIKQIAYKVTTLARNSRKHVTYLSYPIPLDLVMEKDFDTLAKINEKEYKSYDVRLTTQVARPYCHLNHLSLQTEKILSYNKEVEVENIEDGILTDTAINNYLKGKINGSIEATKISDAYKTEAKIGIARQNTTRTADEGKLYRMNMLRPNDVKICIEFTGLDDFAPKGLLRLGAENKLAVYEKTEIHVLNTPKELGENFKIYLATPAIFTNGYYPTKVFENANLQVELTTCAVGKYLNVGGFDMQKREPKPMQKAVPAGSVYYFRLKKGNFQDLVKQLQETGISETEQSQKEGFGIAYIAKI
ncbi:type III-B CRISPR module-associated protein Cmr3 [Hugenholtzia roseola]|uniref:type III-B CRISPR module-associated protein Cmr3 n=1 Tax=Hugenholtzia roseola TaxID=1002 RepID=UPI00041AFB81|nr:type III-B CRISPR module-associated protein Cmr3 [Hugenholtzia roseola]